MGGPVLNRKVWNVESGVDLLNPHILKFLERDVNIDIKPAQNRRLWLKVLIPHPLAVPICYENIEKILKSDPDVQAWMLTHNPGSGSSVPGQLIGPHRHSPIVGIADCGKGE